MKRIAMVAAVVAIAACSKGDKSTTTDTTVAGGMVAPSMDSTGGAMTNGSSSGSMSGSAMGGAASGGMDSSSMNPDSKMGSAMGGDSSGMAGRHGTSDSASVTKNQTQSGMTNSDGHSTLGRKMDKLSPTSSKPVMRNGDTLKKATTPQR